MELSDLTPEVKAKLIACKTPEVVLALAKEQGYELSDAELEEVSGGLFSKPKSGVPGKAPRARSLLVFDS
ncbi:MAG: Nif11-like leader peptide family natural product precursor [Atopobiaceae bacterium]|nr:Nif11-like leader peptide family natural product precursor [Atopobiaceae bacterium]